MSLTRRQTSPARMRSYDPEAEFSQRRPSQQHSSFMSKGVNHLRLSAEPSSRSRGTTSQLRESDTKCLFPPPRRTPTAPSQSDYNSDSQYGATNGYSQDLTQSSIFLRQGRLHSTSAPEQSVPVSGFSYPHIALSDDNDWSNSRQSGQTRAQTWDANCLNSSFLSAQRATAPNGMSFYNSQNPDSSYSQLSRQPSSYVQQQGHRQDLSHSNKSPQDPGGSYGSIMALDEVGTSYSSNHAFTGHDQTRSTLSVPRLGDSYYFPQSRESPRPRAIIGEPAQDNSPPRQISQVVPSPKSQAPTPSLTIPPPQITVSLDKNFGASNFSGYTRSAPPSPSPRGRLRKAHFVEEKQQGNTLVVPGSQQREKKGRARSHSTRVLTDEGRQHANEMRKLRACPSCHQKKVKVIPQNNQITCLIG